MSKRDTKPNPLVNILPFLVAAYGWQLYGWMIGLGVGILYLGIIVVLNNLYLLRFASEDAEIDDLIRTLQRIKWITFFVFVVAIAVPMIRIGTING